MTKPEDVKQGDSCLTRADIFATHAGEFGYVDDVFEGGVALHFPANPTGFEYWSWDEIEVHCPARQ